MLIELDKMSRTELIKLLKAVEKALTEVEQRKRAAAAKAAREAAKAYGYTLSQLLENAPPQNKKDRYVARYHHPENSAITWARRGRPPIWLKIYIAEGKDPETLFW